MREEKKCWDEYTQEELEEMYPRIDGGRLFTALSICTAVLLLAINIQS